jgi:MFS transporter, DHA1 family, multidrug resistance protein
MRLLGWQRNLATLAVAQTVSMVAFSFVFPFIPLYVHDLGVGDTAAAARWAGLITSVSALSMAVAQPIWGSLADRVGRKPMVLRSMLGGALLLSLMAFVQTPEQLLVLRFVQGGITGTVAAANALIATNAPKERLGMALGVMQVSVFLGNSLGPLLGGVIADNWGYRISFGAAGVILVLCSVLIAFGCDERFVRPPPGSPREGVVASGRTLLALPMFPLLASVVFLISFGGMVVSPVLSLFIVDLSGEAGAATAAGGVLAAAGAMSAVAALFVGRMSDRVGARIILPICLVGAAVTYFPQAAVTNVWQLLGLRVLLGAFLGGLMPTANALIAGLVPRERRGSAFGFISMASCTASAIAPLTGAAVASGLGMRWVFLFTGALYGGAFLWTSFAFRRLGAIDRPNPPAPLPHGGRG